MSWCQEQTVYNAVETWKITLPIHKTKVKIYIPIYIRVCLKKIRSPQIRSIIAGCSQPAIEWHFPIASSFRSFCVPRNWFACKGSVWIYVVPGIRSEPVVYFRARYFLLRVRFLMCESFVFMSLSTLFTDYQRIILYYI